MTIGVVAGSGVGNRGHSNGGQVEQGEKIQRHIQVRIQGAVEIRQSQCRSDHAFGGARVLETTQREMTLSLEKTARSSVFNLAHDYSTALFNHVPEMILQGQDIPIHLGSLIPAMKSVARYFGDDIHEGDLILHNDPGLRRQPRHRRVHVQAGLLQGQAASTGRSARAT